MPTPVPTIEITTRRFPLDPPQVTPGGTFEAVWAVDVEVAVDGTGGRGRARAYTDAGADEAATALRALVDDGRVRRALAIPATGRAAAWREAWLALEAEAGPGGSLLALGALDEAVWALDRAPRGAGATSVGVYWSGLWLHSTVEELVAEARWAAGEGFDGAKLRVDGGSVGASVDRVRAVLAAAPPGRWLALELACSGEPALVEELVGAVDPSRLLWVEDPLPPDQLAATADLVDRLPVAVALGEDCWGRAALADRVAATGAPLPILDLGFLGGPTAMLLVLGEGAYGRDAIGVHIDAVLGADVAAAAATAGAPACHVWLEAFAWWGAPSPAEVRAHAGA